MNNKAILYIRFSTTIQGHDDKDSIARQTSSAEKWCGYNNYELVDTFIDIL